MRARAFSLLPTLAQLMQPRDEVLWPASTKPARARTGRAWCPTDWANAQMQRAGMTVPPAPPSAVLRKVNHRRFAHDLGQALPGARFVETQSELLVVLGDSQRRDAVSIERNWLLKRPLGYAGRGRRKVSSATLSTPDRMWIEGALRLGDGLQVEPLVKRELDCALHGWLAFDGTLTLGEPTVTNIDDSGTWLSSERAAATALFSYETEALTLAAKETAHALTRVGYFGPFGIDAFRWRAPDGHVHFQPRCELNARYSMGWAVGFQVPRSGGP